MAPKRKASCLSNTQSQQHEHDTRASRKKLHSTLRPSLPFRLFDLPGELRNTIYRAYRAYFPTTRIKKTNLKWTRILPEILLVSKRVYQEVEPILLEYVELEFENYDMQLTSSSQNQLHQVIRSLLPITNLTKLTIQLRGVHAITPNALQGVVLLFTRFNLLRQYKSTVHPGHAFDAKEADTSDASEELLSRRPLDIIFTYDARTVGTASPDDERFYKLLPLLCKKLKDIGVGLAEKSKDVREEDIRDATLKLITGFQGSEIHPLTSSIKAYWQGRVRKVEQDDDAMLMLTPKKVRRAFSV